MLIEVIARNAGDAQEDRPYRPSPSQVGRCIRALVYHAMGVERDPFPDRTLLVFEDGNWHEELIKDHIRKTVYQLDELKGPKQRFFIADIDGARMEGEIDGLVTDPLSVTRLLEIKSINHFGFQRLDKEPLHEHKGQANLYLHGLNLAGMKINEAIILYKNKNTSAMKEFIIQYDEATALVDIEMFREVGRLAKTNQLPDRPYTYDSWQCSYCRWKKTCWREYPTEISNLSSDAVLSSEIETAARYFNELGGQESDIKKEREKIKKEILLPALKEANAKTARTGEYILSLSITMREEIDRSLVPLDAIQKVISQRFTVKKIKKEDAGDVL